MIKPEFTEQEAQALIDFIDLAVKAAGLKASKAAVAVADKIFAAVEESKADRNVIDMKDQGNG